MQCTHLRPSPATAATLHLLRRPNNAVRCTLNLRNQPEVVITTRPHPSLFLLMATTAVVSMRPADLIASTPPPRRQLSPTLECIHVMFTPVIVSAHRHPVRIPWISLNQHPTPLHTQNHTHGTPHTRFMYIQPRLDPAAERRVVCSWQLPPVAQVPQHRAPYPWRQCWYPPQPPWPCGTLRDAHTSLLRASRLAAMRRPRSLCPSASRSRPSAAPLVHKSPRAPTAKRGAIPSVHAGHTPRHASRAAAATAAASAEAPPSQTRSTSLRSPQSSTPTWPLVRCPP